MNQPKDCQCRVCRPDAGRHSPDVVPRTLMCNNRSPRIRRHKSRHQKIEQSQKIYVYRANAFVTLVVRRENIFNESHTRGYAQNAKDVPNVARMRFIGQFLLSLKILFSE